MSLVVKQSLIKLRDGRLHLYQQNDSKNWLWRTFLNGKYVVRSTKNNNLAVAKSIAENEYDKLRFQTTTADGTVAHSWAECERGFLNSLAHRESKRPVLARNYKVKLGILRQYFNSYPIHTIKTRQIEGYLQWRRHSYQPPYKNYHSKTVSDKTLRSDFTALRQVLKYAKREDWIKVLPDFPSLDVRVRPSGWFSPEEMVKLLEFLTPWVNEKGISTTEADRRAYADCYIRWLSSTGMRVDETLKVQFNDVTIIQRPTGKPVLQVSVTGGKVSYLIGATEIIGLPQSVKTFQRLKALFPHSPPEARIFRTNPSKTIREVLMATGLLFDERKHQRTAKCFRHTYIMSMLLNNVDLFSVAKNCRTSVKMIEKYYASYMTPRMKLGELTKMFSRIEEEEETK